MMGAERGSALDFKGVPMGLTRSAEHTRDGFKSTP